MKKFLKVLTILSSALVVLATSVSAAKFSDVNYSSAEGKAVSALVELDITKGTSDTTFGAKELVTRQQMALFIYRLMNDNHTSESKNTTAFIDVTDPTYFAAISWANEEGVINGTSDTTFNPKGSITLQDAYTMLIRALGYQSLEYPAGYINLATDAAFELNKGIGTSIANTQALTRGNVAILLYNAYNSKNGVVTNYTQEDILNSKGKLVAIGKNDSLNVVAAFNDDYTHVVISKNGKNSDGIMKDWEMSQDNIRTNPIYMKNMSLKSAEIRPGVVNIGSLAFFGCTKFSNFEIPDSVTNVGKRAFAACYGLSDITFSNSIAQIGDSSFWDCKNLKTILFKGTKAEFKTIKIGENWDRNSGDFTIQCTDGNISKE